MVRYYCNKVLSFFSRWIHLRCRSRGFACSLLVFIRRWGGLITRHHTKNNGWLWLADSGHHCPGKRPFPTAVNWRIGGGPCFWISIPLCLLMLFWWSLMEMCTSVPSVAVDILEIWNERFAVDGIHSKSRQCKLYCIHSWEFCKPCHLAKSDLQRPSVAARVTKVSR